MKITITLLENWGACSSGKQYFSNKLPTGSEYANVIAQCDADGEYGYHQWLFNRAFQHLEAKELGEIAQGEAAQAHTYVKKGLEPLAILKEELKDTDMVSKKAKAQLAASGNDSQLAASGERSRLAASGYNSRLAASGNDSQLAASGNDSRLAASGYNSRLAASGENSIIASAAFGTNFKLSTGGCAAIPYKDENGKTRFATAYVGENIEADTWYRANAKGDFIKVEV